MGWNTGSILMSEIIESLKEKVPDDKIRQDIYETLIPAFENYDCFNLDDCLNEDTAFNLAYTEASYFAQNDEDEYLDEEYEESEDE